MPFVSLQTVKVLLACTTFAHLPVAYFANHLTNAQPGYGTSPCHFPLPTDIEAFRSHCSTNYYNLPYVCDPDHMLSRTEVIGEIDAAVRRQNFSTCPCFSDLACHRSQQKDVYVLKVSLVLAHTLHRHAPPSELACKGTESTELTAVHIQDAARPLGTMYANVIRRRWSTESCSPDVLILVAARWTSVDNALMPFFFVSVRDEVLRRFPTVNASLQRVARELNNQSATRMHASGLSAQIVRLLTAFANPAQRHEHRTLVFGMPLWALILIVCCSATSLACFLVGHCFSTYGKLLYTKKPQRGVQVPRKWQAGFAGGLWENI